MNRVWLRKPFTYVRPQGGHADASAELYYRNLLLEDAELPPDASREEREERIRTVSEDSLGPVGPERKLEVFLGNRVTGEETLVDIVASLDAFLSKYIGYSDP